MDKRLYSLIKFIKENYNWEQRLQDAPFFLKIRHHPTNKERYMFSYNHIFSDFSYDICKVSRGLILDIPKSPMNEITVVARGFDKFHNYGEPNADQINWNGKIYARAKEDGSLIKLFIDKDNTKCWATNNGFDANASLPGDLINEFDTFQNLIDDAMFDKKLPSSYLLQEYTLLFELVSPLNRIVCRYPKTDLIFLGARSNYHGNEIMPETFLKQIATMRGFSTPKIYELSSKTIEEVQAIVAEFDSNHEGIVIQDENFNRIKLKGTEYLKIHKVKDNNGQLSHKHLFKCIQSETIDDIIGVFPEHAQRIRNIINQYKILDATIDTIINEAKTYIKIVNQNKDERDRKKAYAMLVKDSPFAKIFFNIYKNPENALTYKQDYLNNLDYEGFLNIYDKIK
jgi:T4 RnlA family RNA ligase